MKNVSNATIDNDIGLAINGKRSHRERDSNPVAKHGDSIQIQNPQQTLIRFPFDFEAIYEDFYCFKSLNELDIFIAMFQDDLVADNGEFIRKFYFIRNRI